LILSANISETDGAVNKQSTALSTTFLLRWTKKLVNFVLLTTKLCLLILTYSASIIRAFSDNSRIWSHISREWIEISINGKKRFTTMINFTSNAKKLVNLVHKQPSSVVLFQTAQFWHFPCYICMILW